MNEKVQASIKAIQRNHDQPIDKFKNGLCTHLCMITDSVISYYATWNQTQQTLTMIAWSKSAMLTCCTIEKPMVYKLNETGLWGDAIRERKAVITNDYQNLVKPTKKGYPHGHVHLKRHLNLPIYEHGKIVFVIGVGNKATDYTQEDVKNMEDFLHGIWRTLKSKLL